ncbi:PTS sugar transporter subunit IIA [Mycoplasmopsis adleri]|uniref:PTS sugar transporter subunit IIA n=1 Tax=Mycoplasmopsis adleri TaxID=51362 RepID=UPI0038737FE2
MTHKEKFLIVILTIFTLGFCWLYWHCKNKKQQELKKGNVTKLDSRINIEELITLLGGKENITGIEPSLSKVKILFKNKANVNFEEIKNLKYVSGILISSNSTNIIVGEYAKKIAEVMKEELKSK